MKTTVAAVVALALAGAAGWAHVNRDAIRALGGPQVVTMVEVYEPHEGGPRFDHQPFDALLRKHVDKDGWVNYTGLARDADSLDQYVAALGRAPFDEQGRDEKLTLLINAYNAFTLRLILDHYPLKSIKDIPAQKRWEDQRWNVGGHVWSLNQIEHEQIRPKFREPRIHFALVCAAVGCPKLRHEAYATDRIETQLEDQARYANNHDRWLRYDRDGDVLWLTKLYDWYGGDFEQANGSVTAYAAKYSSDLERALEAGRSPKIRWLDYDWNLNDKRPAAR